MRLHQLQVTAFGPFGGTESVDFDELSEAGLFLLHGPTGAGKTSVLDAVCYALFARVPGARQSADRLRSDYAEPLTRTSVSCELTASGRRFRVTRHPSWQRPKRRGAGSTTEPARVELEELRGGTWHVHTTRNDEAAHLLDQVLGMGADQFTKLVLLPQGEFAAFLRADAEERRRMLERLFGTDSFRTVQEWLRERAKAAREQVQEADVVLRGLLAAARAAAGQLPGPAQPAEGADADPLDLVRRLHQDAEALWQLRSSQAVQAEHDAVAAQTALLAARRTAELQARATLARQQLDVLRSGEADVEHARRLISRAALAAPVAEVLAAVETTARSAGLAARSAHTALAAPSLAELDLLLPGRCLPGRCLPTDLGAAEQEQQVRLVSELAGAAASELVRLEAAIEAELRLRTAQDRSQQLRNAIERHEQEVAALQARQAGLTGQVRTAEADLEQARLVAAGQGPAAEQVTRAEQRAAAAARARELVQEQAAGAAEQQRRTAQALQAKQDWLTLYEHRLSGMAAELAADLSAGQACPVCGSCDHPEPAGPDAVPAVTAAEVDAARRSHEVADQLWQQTIARQAEIGRQLAGALAAAEGVDAQGAAQQLDQARRQLAGARAAGDTAATLAGWLVELRGQQEDTAAELATAASLLDRSRQARQEVEQAARELTDQVSQARGGHPDVGARTAALTRLRTALDAAVHALRDAVQAQRAADQTRAGAVAVVQAHGFADLDDARSALLAKDRLAELTATVGRHEEELGAARRELADPELRAAAQAVPPNLAELSDAAAQADAARRELTRLAALAESATGSLAATLEQVARHQARTGPLVQRHDLLDALSRCADGTGGDNRLKMTLSAFVLAARLEEVAAAASERLQVMSSGRYTLVHSEQARGRGRQGLSLHVVDAWTGQQRDTATLSGGESFYTSLALALGLADVVCAEAGGTSIETLFVDEGFGTLDPDTLEEVMDVLDRLRDGGRTVGLVSHVPELRQRIPASVEIVRTQSGSLIRAGRRPEAGDPETADALFV